MKKTLYILFITLFFLLCAVPVAGLLLGGASPAAANEAPAAAPSLTKFDGTVNTGFFTDLQNYVNKGFFLRLDCITGWDRLCADVFHTSANDSVLLGPDGWLFFGEAVNDISGANQLTDDEIWASARSLYLMQEYAQSQGAKFIFTVPCGKYTLYPEHAPDFVTVAESSNRERLTAALREQGVNYADLYEAFTAADEELYWQWDSHWNARGAALGADTILAAADMPGGWFDGGFTEEVSHFGDLYEMLYPKGTARETDYTTTQPLNFQHTSNFNSYDDIIITTEREGAEGSLLLFRDSSGRNLYPYLAERFGKAYISRLNNYRLDLISEQNATVVVAELAERTLNFLLKYPAVYPAPERDASVLNHAAAAESDLAVDETDTSMEGCVKLTGTLPEGAGGACVYVRLDGTVYEAIPGSGTFTAWLPAGANALSAEVYIEV